MIKQSTSKVKTRQDATGSLCFGLLLTHIWLEGYQVIASPIVNTFTAKGILIDE